MSETSYTVTGMSCQHCVASVQEEINEIPGVRHVAVDLSTGTVSVTSEHPLPAARVAEAVSEAGYQLNGN